MRGHSCNLMTIKGAVSSRKQPHPSLSSWKAQWAGRKQLSERRERWREEIEKKRKRREVKEKKKKERERQRDQLGKAEDKKRK